MKPASEECDELADSANEEFQSRIPPLDLQRFLTREHHRIHLIGVAGSGMSGLAGLLIELGHAVSGSDKVTTTETERLQGWACGFMISIGRSMRTPPILSFF